MNLPKLTEVFVVREAVDKTALSKSLHDPFVKSCLLYVSPMAMPDEEAWSVYEKEIEPVVKSAGWVLNGDPELGAGFWYHPSAFEGNDEKSMNPLTRGSSDYLASPAEFTKKHGVFQKFVAATKSLDGDGIVVDVKQMSTDAGAKQFYRELEGSPVSKRASRVVKRKTNPYDASGGMKN